MNLGVCQKAPSHPSKPLRFTYLRNYQLYINLILSAGTKLPCLDVTCATRRPEGRTLCMSAWHWVLGLSLVVTCTPGSWSCSSSMKARRRRDNLKHKVRAGTDQGRAIQIIHCWPFDPLLFSLFYGTHYTKPIDYEIFFLSHCILQLSKLIFSNVKILWRIKKCTVMRLTGASPLLLWLVS